MVSGRFGGGVASKKAVELIFKDSLKATQDFSSVMLEIHKALISSQKEDKNLLGMATTLTYGVFTKDGLKGAHCGDTRIILLRGKGVKKVTQDHTEVQRLLNAGKLTKNEALNYSRKHILDSALGSDDSPRIDPVDIDVQSGDRFVFTTDGVHDKIHLRELFQISQESSSPQEFVEDVEAEIKKRVAEDNYSLVCVDVY